LSLKSIQVYIVSITQDHLIRYMYMFCTYLFHKVIDLSPKFYPCRSSTNYNNTQQSLTLLSTDSWLCGKLKVTQDFVTDFSSISHFLQCKTSIYVYHNKRTTELCFFSLYCNKVLICMYTIKAI